MMKRMETHTQWEPRVLSGPSPVHPNFAAEQHPALHLRHRIAYINDTGPILVPSTYMMYIVITSTRQLHTCEFMAS